MKYQWLLALSFLTVTAHATWSDGHIRGPAEKEHARVQLRPSSLVSGVYQQSVDHFGQAPGQIFNQRYWVDSEYASGPNAPVIYHICGESDAEGAYFFDDAANVWAKSLGARLVYLEHRYYGQSLPFPDLSNQSLQFLTLENVIEDLAGFQKWITANQGWTGKWISVGGSYSGTLSAIYRQKHPELVVGALASSAPMIAGVGQAVDSAGDIGELSSTDPSDDSGARQWAYEACSSLGFWEADGPDLNSTAYYPSQNLCQQLFGNAPFVDINKFNQAYDAPFLADSTGAPSNILFTYGGQDVWTNLGLSQQTNSNSAITILMIQGAGHHFDLNAPSPDDSSAVVSARAEFVTLAKQWLDL